MGTLGNNRQPHKHHDNRFPKTFYHIDHLFHLFYGKFNFLFKCDLTRDLFEDIDLYDFDENSCYTRDKCA